MPADPAELNAVAAALQSAAEATDDADTAADCRSLADRFTELADTEPDHGTLARLDNSLRDLIEETTQPTTDHVETAREEVRAYRTGVDGV